jgi:hypothetical protein
MGVAALVVEQAGLAEMPLRTLVQLAVLEERVLAVPEEREVLLQPLLTIRETFMLAE